MTFEFEDFVDAVLEAIPKILAGVVSYYENFNVEEFIAQVRDSSIGILLLQAVVIAVVVELIRRYGVNAAFGRVRHSRARYLGTVVQDLWSSMQELKVCIGKLYQGYRVPDANKKWRGYIYQLAADDFVQSTLLKENLIKTENALRQLRNWIYSSYYIFPPGALGRISNLENSTSEIERIISMLSYQFTQERADAETVVYWTERIEDTIEIHSDSLMKTFHKIKL